MENERALNPQPPTPTGEPPIASSSLPTALQPIVRIGIESELSKYPVHNLSQRGSINIEIREKNEKGQLLVKWEVSYNNRYGRPGPLAYKADTTVVNRRIDEARHVSPDGNAVPLPEVLPIGGLHEIAAMLNLGGDTNSVKRALRQNVGILISAKIKQKLIDGTERSLEADFSRYSVVFTGEKLPDGRRADRVYLILNKLYRDILNSAPIQPQNWAHTDLPAASHRFYVLLSGRMYATLGSNNKEAKIPYSYFCQRAPLTRHQDYDKFQSQMYKIQKPLKEAGYIKDSRWEERQTLDGSRDWMMFYTPGALAKAEYNEFNPGKRQLPIEPGEIPPPPKRPRQRRLNLAPAAEPEQKPGAAFDRVINELAARGVGDTDARNLLAGLLSGQPVLDQLEYGDYLIARKGGKIANPPGFYISLLRRNVPVPRSFETSRDRQARQQAETAKRQAILDQQAAALTAEEAERQERDRAIAALPREVHQALFDQAKFQLLASHPGMAHFFQTNPDNATDDGAVRARMRQLLAQGWKS